MTTDTRQIMLVGGPLDGETHTIPASEAGLVARRYVPPRPASIVALQPEGTIPEMPRFLVYRPLTVDFMGWPVLSITDNGTIRYQYAGES